MASLTLGQKAGRVLQLLLGCRHAGVGNLLAKRGFDEAERKHGWQLLEAASFTKLGTDAAVPDQAALTALDEWENTWFPVAEATLAARFPAIHDKVFLNLSQTDGAEVIISVGLFLNRYDVLDKPEGGYGPDGVQAKALLATRGLTDDELNVARGLIAVLKTLEPASPPPDTEAQRANADKAEAALWTWYIEWSKIARSQVKSRTMLRQLGFLRGNGSTEDDPETPGPAPAPTVPVVATPASTTPASPNPNGTAVPTAARA